MNYTEDYKEYSVRQLKILRLKLKKKKGDIDLIEFINNLIKKKQSEYWQKTEITLTQRLIKALGKINK